MSDGERRYQGPVIDACVHHHWQSQLEVTDFMSAGWREHIGVPGTLPGGAGAVSSSGPAMGSASSMAKPA